MKDRVVAVTGASRGIGLAVAQEFAGSGAILVLISRNINDLNNALTTLPGKSSSEHITVEADISDGQSVKTAFEKIFKTVGNVDILINNAGFAFFKPVMEIEPEDWDKMMGVNLRGAYLCSKMVLPGMISKRSGHIFNISSVSAIKAFPFNTAYSASKAGLLAFGNSLREEVRQHGIKVVNVIPGATNTPIWDDLQGNFDREKMIDRSDIAKTIAGISCLSGKTTVEQVIIRPGEGDF
ncbi:SDR family oxidoreductase [candidate division KSB1 bacterium]